MSEELSEDKDKKSEVVETDTDDDFRYPKNELSGDTFVRKDNSIITAKYKSTLLENQVTTICLSRMRKQGDKYIASATADELRSILKLKKNNTSLYKRLRKVADSITGRKLVIEDPNGFDVINVITDASFRDGIFSMRFNDKMNPFFELKDKYTTYRLANIISIQCDYSFRIYELIKQEAYHISKDRPVVTVQYGLSEFECMIGMVDINTDKIKREMSLKKRKDINWDKVVEMAPEHTYSRWADFKRYVLDKAKEEINETCDTAFDYTPIRHGRGGKVAGIKLHIRKNDRADTAALADKQQKIEEINIAYEGKSAYVASPELLRYIGHNGLKASDIKMFLQDADGNDSLVIKAIKAADEKDRINNYVGWIRACIRRGGYDETQVEYGSAEAVKDADRLRHNMEAKSEILAGDYWRKLKAKHGGKFDDFVSYIESCGMSLDMFESANTEAECGEKYFKWYKNEPFELI